MTPADFRTVTHLLPEACLLVDASGHVLSVNPAAERLTGMSRGELEGGRLMDLVGDDPGDIDRFLASASRTRGPVSGAITLTCTEETACACLGGVVQPTRGDQPARIMLQIKERSASTNRFRLLNEQVDRLTQEIRKRREAERQQARMLERENVMRKELEAKTDEIERSRALLEESQRSARVGSWEWDMATDTLVWSDELYRIYGLDPARDEISFETYESLVHPDDLERMREVIGEAVETGEPFAIEHRIVTPSGDVRVLQGRGRVITDTEGRAIRLIGSGQDITERTWREDQTHFLAEAGHVLTTSLDYQETLKRVAELAVPRIADWAAVDVIQDGEVRRLAIAHPDPKKLAVAEEAARRWPETPERPGAVTIVHQTGEPLLLPEIPDALLEEMTQDVEHLAVIRELGLRSAMVVPLAARGQIVGSITLVASESGRRFGDDDLALAQELADRAGLAVDNARLYHEAQEASRARDDLMAIVSHDLRSPLNAVLAGASLLLDVPLSEEKRRDQYRAISRSAQRMERLTRDLLDLTRIEAGHLRVEPKAEEARQLVEDALDAATFAAGRTGVFLSSKVAEGLPRIRADRQRIVQVLDNLLSNAIRYTPEGGRVTVGAERTSEGVRFCVADTGPGIPGDLQDHIFDRYWQAEQPDHGGAGLGLPIAKGLVDAHRGRIWVETEEGKGTTFFFVLPIATERDNEESAVA